MDLDILRSDLVSSEAMMRADLPPRFVVADPDLDHQLILNFDKHEIYVTCNCLLRIKRGRYNGSYDKIEQRLVFPAAEAIAAWRQWHADRGIEIPSPTC